MSGNVTNPGQNGYFQATDLAVNVDNVSNPDGPLAGPLAAQESAMYLKPAHLANGEKVLRIVDFIDKIISDLSFPPGLIKSLSWNLFGPFHFIYTPPPPPPPPPVDEFF